MELKSYFVAIVCLGLSLCEVIDSVKIAYSSPPEGGQQYWNDLAKQEMETVKKRFSTINQNAMAKNIIFFIGDGMGIPTLTAARTLKAQLANVRPGHPRLHFEEFPHVGLVQTYNTDFFGPDSAGTATAYLCGVKANLGVIGLDERVPYSNCSMFKQNQDAKVKCVPETAAAAGKSIGFVTTKSITDASPAPIYSATPDREWQSDKLLSEEAVKNGCKDIAVQLVDNGDYVNVALGGGLKYFAANERNDKRSLPQEWVDKRNSAGRKAQFISTGTSLRSLDTNSVTDLLGIFAGGNMNFDQDRISSGSDEPSLTEMALTALKIVQKNRKGYFLFIEGGKIDSAHHENMAGHALYETLAFESAIAAIMKQINTEETIVLVSADHSHVFSYGSYMTRENFILDPTDSSLDEKGNAFTSLSYGNGPGFVPANDGNRRNLTANQTNSLSYRYEATVPLDYETHGAEEVAVYAKGPQAHLISALIEQNTIAHVMMYSTCIGPYTKNDHCETATGGSAGLTQSRLALALELTLALVLVYRF